MNYKDEVKRIGLQMREKSVFFHKRINKAPEGTLQIVNDGGYIRVNAVMQENGKTKRVGIKKNQKLTQAYVNKAMDQVRVDIIDADLKILQEAYKAMQGYDENKIVKRMPENSELLGDTFLREINPKGIHPVRSDAVRPLDARLYVPEDDRFEWGSKPYRANDLNAGSVSHKSEDGMCFRSKSELALFQIYRKYNIPLHYDEVLNFGGVLKSPDFILMRYDGKLIFHEHCGMMSNPEYRRNYHAKLDLYEKFGIVPWDNLILTYDSADGILDLALAEASIKSMLRII